MKREARIGLGILLGAVVLSALLIGMAFRRQSAAPLPVPEGDRGATAGTGGERSPGGPLGSPGGVGRLPAADIPDVAPAGSRPGTLSTVTVQSGGSEAFGLAGNVPAGSDPGPVEAGQDTADVPGSPGAPAEAGRGGDAPAGRRDVGGAPAEVAPASGREFGYTVQPGDSPWKISERFYGSGGHWKRILDANPGVSSERLQVGTKLVIPGRAGPDQAAAVARRPEAPPAPAGAARVHRVAPGDSLYSLAEKYLGAGTRYGEIGSLNPGIDSNNLKVGQEIRIPAR